MRRRHLLQALATTPLLARVDAAATELVVAVNRTTIESAPLLVQAIPGIRVVPVANGRAASAELVAGRVDVATGSETQALLNSVAQPDLRIVLTLAECRYRMVARRSAGIAAIADLRGKRVAHTPGTSSQYFLADMLARENLDVNDVSLVVLEGPDMPGALAARTIDAMAMWEPHAQNALAALGTDGVVLSHPAAYFERFNLNTTAAVLDDPARRSVLREALPALAAMSARLVREPAPLLPALARAIATPIATIEAVWPQFGFPARLDAQDLLGVLAAMEPWAADVAGRTARSRGALAQLIDGSVAMEAGL